MYSPLWFETFASRTAERATQADLAGIASACPVDRFPRLIELGCGAGRICGPLAQHGYQVVGLDLNLEALRIARHTASGPDYIALDQRHAGGMGWQFDAALILWNSLGFVDRAADLETLQGIARILRPGGRLILDLYHPGWLQCNQQAGYHDPRGAQIDRWLQERRCFHRIRYPDGSVDQIAFKVYEPDEMRALAGQAGLYLQASMVWWDPARLPSPEDARYQLVCTHEYSDHGHRP